MVTEVVKKYNEISAYYGRWEVLVGNSKNRSVLEMAVNYMRNKGCLVSISEKGLPKPFMCFWSPPDVVKVKGVLEDKVIVGATESTFIAGITGVSMRFAQFIPGVLILDDIPSDYHYCHASEIAPPAVPQDAKNLLYALNDEGLFCSLQYNVGDSVVSATALFQDCIR